MSATTITLAITSSLTISFTVGQVLLFAGSIIYQRYQQKKMQDELDKRKGFEITRRQEAGNLPVFYGYNKAGSIITDLKVKDSWVYASPSNYTSGAYDPSPDTYKYDSNNYLSVSISYTLEASGSDDWIEVAQANYNLVWGGTSVYTKSVTIGDRWRYDSVSALKEAVISRISSLTFDDAATRYFFGDIVTISDTQYEFPVRKFTYASDSNTSLFTIMKNSKSGSKNEILMMQQAISFGGINSVIDVDLDDTSIKNRKFGKYRNTTRTGKMGYDIRVYPDGGFADGVAIENGFPSTNVFTDTCYANCTYMLNRDDPAFSGIPNATFYIEGQRIYDIEENGGVYSLSSGKKFSNNSALVLLDYLTNSDYGRGLPLSSIDLESFYNAKVVCDKVVYTEATVSGKVYGGAQIRPIKLYEFNDVIDTEEEVRVNAQKILESMGQAFLLWSEGKYKLSCVYPEEQPSVANGMVHSDHVFDDSDIIREDINISWPNAENKFNQITVKFPNAFKDFKSDDATWPPSESAVHLAYLQEDNNQPLKSEIQLPGLVDPYRAKARAEQLVRTSRNTHSLEITLSRKAIRLEPGDFFILSSEIANIDSELYRVEKIEFDSEFNVKITAYSFNYLNLAWNIADDAIWTGFEIIDGAIFPPTNLVFDTNVSGNANPNLSGILSWTAAAQAKDYYVEISRINPGTPANPVSDPQAPGTREQMVYDLFQEVFYRAPDQSGFDYYLTEDLQEEDDLREVFYNAVEKKWVEIGYATDTFKEILNLESASYDFSIKTRTPDGKFSDRIILRNQATERRDPVTINITPVNGLAINKNLDNSYTADFLDFDVEAYQLDTLVSKRRFRLNRVGQTWNTLVEDRDLDIDPNQLNVGRITAKSPPTISSDGLSVTLDVTYDHNNVVSSSSVFSIIQLPNNAITVDIDVSGGTVFKNSSGDPKTLTANVFVGGEPVTETEYDNYTYRWSYNGNLVYMSTSRELLDDNGVPRTTSTTGAEPADSTLTSNYTGSLRSIIVGPEDVTNVVKLSVEIGGIE
jgi:hypothetical protein